MKSIIIHRVLFCFFLIFAAYFSVSSIKVSAARTIEKKIEAQLIRIIGHYPTWKKNGDQWVTQQREYFDIAFVDAYDHVRDASQSAGVKIAMQARGVTDAYEGWKYFTQETGAQISAWYAKESEGLGHSLVFVQDNIHSQAQQKCAYLKDTAASIQKNLHASYVQQVNSLGHGLLYIYDGVHMTYIRQAEAFGQSLITIYHRLYAHYAQKFSSLVDHSIYMSLSALDTFIQDLTLLTSGLNTPVVHVSEFHKVESIPLKLAHAADTLLSYEGYLLGVSENPGENILDEKRYTVAGIEMEAGTILRLEPVRIVAVKKAVSQERVHAISSIEPAAGDVGITLPTKKAETQTRRIEWFTPDTTATRVSIPQRKPVREAVLVEKIFQDEIIEKIDVSVALKDTKNEIPSYYPDNTAKGMDMTAFENPWVPSVDVYLAEAETVNVALSTYHDEEKKYDFIQSHAYSIQNKAMIWEAWFKDHADHMSLALARYHGDMFANLGKIKRAVINKASYTLQAVADHVLSAFLYNLHKIYDAFEYFMMSNYDFTHIVSAVTQNEALVDIQVHSALLTTLEPSAGQADISDIHEEVMAEMQEKVALLAALEPAAGRSDIPVVQSDTIKVVRTYDLKERVLETEAVLTARKSAVISSSLDGRIKDIPFKNGDLFKAGSVLIEYECDGLKAQHRALTKKSNLAKEKYARIEELIALGLASKIEELDTLTEKEVFEAELDVLQSRLDACVIKASFDGRVTNLLANIGEYTRTDRVLMEVASQDTLNADMLLSSEWLRWLDVGAPVKIYIKETDKYYEGEISRIYGEIDPVTQSVEAEVSLATYQDRLLPGMGGNAVFDLKAVREAGVHGYLEKAKVPLQHMGP